MLMKTSFGHHPLFGSTVDLVITIEGNRSLHMLTVGAVVVVVVIEVVVMVVVVVVSAQTRSDELVRGAIST